MMMLCFMTITGLKGIHQTRFTDQFGSTRMFASSLLLVLKSSNKIKMLSKPRLHSTSTEFQHISQFQWQLNESEKSSVEWSVWPAEAPPSLSHGASLSVLLELIFSTMCAITPGISHSIWHPLCLISCTKCWRYLSLVCVLTCQFAL